MWSLPATSSSSRYDYTSGAYITAATLPRSFCVSAMIMFHKIICCITSIWCHKVFSVNVSFQKLSNRGHVCVYVCGGVQMMHILLCVCVCVCVCGLCHSRVCLQPDWKVADPICTFLFSILVLFSTINILKDALLVLMEGERHMVHTCIACSGMVR